MHNETTKERWGHTVAYVGVLCLAPWLLAWKSAQYAHFVPLVLTSLLAIANVLYIDWLIPRHPKRNLQIIWLILNLIGGVTVGWRGNWFMAALIVLAAILWVLPNSLAQQPLELKLLPIIADGLAPLILSVVLYDSAEGALFIPALIWPLLSFLTLAATSTMATISRGPIRLTVALGTSVVVFAIGALTAHLSPLILLLPIAALLLSIMPQRKSYWSPAILSIASIIYCLIAR